MVFSVDLTELSDSQQFSGGLRPYDAAPAPGRFKKSFPDTFKQYLSLQLKQVGVSSNILQFDLKNGSYWDYSVLNWCFNIVLPGIPYSPDRMYENSGLHMEAEHLDDVGAMMQGSSSTQNCNPSNPRGGSSVNSLDKLYSMQSSYFTPE